MKQKHPPSHLFSRLSPSDGPDLEDVAVRSAALVRVPRNLQEDFRVLRQLGGCDSLGCAQWRAKGATGKWQVNEQQGAGWAITRFFSSKHEWYQAQFWVLVQGFERNGGGNLKEKMERFKMA